MKILVTGASGFIGQHLVLALKQGGNEVLEIDRNQTDDQMFSALLIADFIYHLAGVNRSNHASEFIEGNVNLIKRMTFKLIELHKKTPILMTSSIQADLESDYGLSKKQAEAILRNYSQETQAPIFIYRLSNVFGKWCRPHYNSVIATFCYQITRNQEVFMNDSKTMIQFIYIDDVIQEFIEILKQPIGSDDYFEVKPVYQKTLGEVYDLLLTFQENRGNPHLINLRDSFNKKLNSTFLSYLPTRNFSYPLDVHSDFRGDFTELFKIEEYGQISLNVTKPGFIKGNHWHHTKTEKFLVIAGEGVIRLRQPSQTEVIEIAVCGERLEVVDIPAGYTHHLENTGLIDLITIMWANECFDSNHPDTFYLEV